MENGEWGLGAPGFSRQKLNKCGLDHISSRIMLPEGKFIKALRCWLPNFAENPLHMAARLGYAIWVPLETT
jgi:hypothetical protein